MNSRSNILKYVNFTRRLSMARLPYFGHVVSSAALCCSLLSFVMSEATAKDTHHPAEIAISGISGPVPVNAVPPITLKFTALQDASRLQVELNTGGCIVFATGNGSTTNRMLTALHRVRAYKTSTSMDVTLQLTAKPREGDVEIRVAAFDENGKVLSRMQLRINGYVSDGKLFYGSSSMTKLKLLAIQDLEQRGAISHRERLQRQESLLRSNGTARKGDNR